MRLIDADKIIDSFGNSDMDFAIGAVIDEQPTAFDADKVMEQLESRKARAVALQEENTSEYFETREEAKKKLEEMKNGLKYLDNAVKSIEYQLNSAYSHGYSDGKEDARIEYLKHVKIVKMKVLSEDDYSSMPDYYKSWPVKAWCSCGKTT